MNAFGHRDEHDVHDPDATHEQAHAGDPGEEEREGAGRFVQRLEEVDLSPDLKVVVLSGADPVRPPDDLLELGHGERDRCFIAGEDEDVVQPFPSEETVSRGPDRNEDLLVRVAHTGHSLQRHDANDRELHALNPHALSDDCPGIVEAEFLEHGPADHGHPFHEAVLGAGEHPPRRHVVLADFQVVRRRAGDLDADVRVTELDRQVAVLLRLHRHDIPGPFADGRDIIEGERCDVGRADAAPPDPVGPDTEQRSAQRLDPVGDLLLRAAAKRDHGDDRPDADDDPQHREQGPHLVGGERAKGLAQRFRRKHAGGLRAVRGKAALAQR